MKKVSLKTLWQLFATFFKIGLFTFGGGYAMISVIERETVERKQWVTSQDIMDMVIIAESTPGVIAVNSATFIGFKVGGVLGSLIATLGVVLPSFVIISALYFVLEQFLANVWVAAAFKGVRAAVTVLIANAVSKLFKLVDKNVYSYVVLAVCFLVATFTNFNVIWLILIGAVLGLLYKLFFDKASIKPAAVNDKPSEEAEQ